MLKNTSTKVQMFANNNVILLFKNDSDDFVCYDI